ncbi:MAG: hypothetical protein DMF56_12885 [Acidobacteria bacterium]|nr:MAG: hypothetical protein DMF56_12885 [Acidobacteriota bacterium]
MRIARVLTLILLATPAFAILRGTSERELLPRQLDLAESSQMSGRIASDGTSFLAVWNDAHNRDGDILGARLAQDGTVVDSVPLVVANTPSNETEPAVAWGRDRYLVAWATENEPVRGRFVTSVGTMSGTIQIGTRAAASGYPWVRMAFNGSRFLVAWFESDQLGSSIQGATVDLDGHVVQRELLRPATFGFELAALAGTFYLVRVDDRRVVAIPLDDAMNPGATVLLDDSPHPVLNVHVAARGDDLLIAWTGSSSAKYIQTVRLTAGGEQERWAFDSEPSTLWEVVTDGNGYLLLYGDFSSVRARRPGSGGETMVAIPPLPATVDNAASNGSRTIALIRTTESLESNGDLSVSVIGEDHVTPLVVAPRHETDPEVATAGDRKLAVWTEFLTAENRLMVAAARFDANGSPLDTQPMEIGSLTTREGRRPRVASDGSGWLVIWEYNSRVLGRRIRRNGAFLDATPLDLGSSANAISGGHTAVAWDGMSYLVAFTSGTIGRFVFVRTFITRVPSTGNPSPAFPINESGSNFYPAIAAGPDAALIVWTTNDRLRGMLLSHNDAMTPVTFSVGPGYAPSVAWNRDAFLVAIDSVPYSPARELRWARVDAFGNALESFSTINVGPAFTPPRVLPFGDHFLLLWAQQHLFGAILDRNANLIEGPALIAENVQAVGADAGQIVTSKVVEHPTRPSRIFLQSVEWIPENVPRRRVVRH